MNKFAIVYGVAESILAKKAIEVLSNILHDYVMAYPICISAGEFEKHKDNLTNHRFFFIGTKTDNPYLTEITAKALTHAEEYSITVKNGSTYIEGFDYNGVIYGCIDFYNYYILKNEHPHDNNRYTQNPFEKSLPDFCYSSYPAAKDRGIWTWGHVIYDYRAFFENMLKLKMNHVVIWNDHGPINGREMVEYAHSCGIKVIWGYSWMWDVDCAVFLKNGLRYDPYEYIEKYEQEYLNFGGDGIYFQSFTEKNTDTIGGIVIAEAVTEFVNVTSTLFLERHPNTELLFGLHATSVKEKLEYIKNVNSKVKIVWEDCGAFPFHYLPSEIENFNKTKEFAASIAKLRGENDAFGIVTKGFTKLDWPTFEHLDGPIFIGASSKLVKNSKIAEKSKDWKYLQAYWLENADKAYEMIKALIEIKKGNILITALVEDGMFEENIMYPVALLAEMLWDTKKDLKELLRDAALRNSVVFA